MKIRLSIFIFLSLIIACSGTGMQKNARVPGAISINNFDSSIHPLLEIGGCYLYEIKKDTIAGLLLAAINKEEDSVYYSFMLSGKFFSTIPSVQEYHQAGLCGLEIPSYPEGEFQKSYSRYFISEHDLKPCINRLKKISNINLSKKNTYGSHSPIGRFEELADQFKFFKLRNAEIEKQIKETGLPSSKYSVIEWKDLIVTDNPEEMVRPEVIWILSARTAHPKAAALMKEDWFWNPADDFSPFGNDDGSDAFYIFKDWRETHPYVNPAIFIIELERRWGMSFSHINKDSEADLPLIEKENRFYRNIDRAIIGLAFGQLVLEGEISPKLKKLGIKAIKREKTEFSMNGMSDGNKNEYRSRLNKMQDILNKF